MKRKISLTFTILLIICMISVTFVGCGADKTNDAVEKGTEKSEASDNSKKSETESTGDSERAAEMKNNSGIDGFQFADHIIEKVEQGKPLELVAIHQDVSTTFSQVIGNGAKDAGKDLGINVEYTGPTAEQDIETMVSIVENFISKKVDGLMIANVNGEALNPVIEKAINAGIPVITFGTDSPGALRFAFVGQDYYQSGIAQANILAEYMEEKGKVLIYSCAVSAQWSLMREKGVRDGLDKFDDIEVVNVIETGTEDQQVYAAIENGILGNPEVNGIASLCAVTTPVTGRVIDRNNLGDKIVHVGHDLDPATLENIKSGATKASLSQDPHKQGYEGIKMLYDYVINGDVPETLDTGIKRVDETNVDEYLEKLEAGEPIG